jgi:hypothetical protein
MKPLAILAFLTATAPAYAGSPKCGESYDLAPRHAVVPKPAEDKAAAAPDKNHSLSDAQVAKVVADRLADIGHCWTKLPPKDRVDGTAILRLVVAPKGDVLDVALGGDVPSGAQPCMKDAIGRWVFPATEIASQVEYPVALRTL